ncbi:hypothetical protein SCLCIDRAFT_1218455, partial [Scleroderma citrinum Foug A]
MSPNPPAASTASVLSTSEIVFYLNEFPVPRSLGQTNNNTNTSSAVNIDPLLTSSAPTSSGGNGPQGTQPQPPKPQHSTVPCGVSLLRVSLNTPAQQVLISAANWWGLVGLLAMTKDASADPDDKLSSVGTDLGTVGLDMAYEGIEPNFHLPMCYNMQVLPPGPSKVGVFSDETLFYMFYSSLWDALQEVAAQITYHKDLQIWITKESGSVPSMKSPDPELWCKDWKEMVVWYSDLEERTSLTFPMGPGLILVQPQGKI